MPPPALHCINVDFYVRDHCSWISRRVGQLKSVRTLMAPWSAHSCSAAY